MRNRGVHTFKQQATRSIEVKQTTRIAVVALAASIGLILQSPARADYVAAVLADNPTGYWRFNDANTNGSADNLGTEGAAYDGTYVGGTLVPAENFTLIDGRQVTGLGAGNTAYRVGDELDEYMTVEESILSDLQEFTLSAWIYPEARAGTRVGLFGQNDAVEFGFINPTQIQLWTPSGQVLNYTIDPVNQIPDETWFHLAAVANGNNIRLFLNGQPMSPGASYGTSDFNFNIAGGGVYDPTGNQFTGTVDEVGIWTKALTEEQILAHVTAAKTAGGDYAATVLTDSPLGYWSFNDADGSPAVNTGTGGTALNGTYTGGDRTAAGPDETYPGFAAGNRAFAAEAPDDGFISIDASPLSGLQEFTLSGWVKPGFISDDRVGLFGQNDALEFGFINPTTLQMWSPGGGAVNFTIDGFVNEDEWVHIAAVGTGDEIQIYIDGELVATGGTPVGGNPIASYGASDFFFNVGGGGVYDVTGNQFNGQIDELAFWDTALTDAQILAHFQAALGGVLVGDFDGSGQLDGPDIDDLTAKVASMTNPAGYDLNNDSLVNNLDINVWVKDLFNSWIGDADLDGEFSSADLVNVLASGTYEVDVDSVWTTGDFNGDGRTNSSDLVAALADGGYELGARPAAAVPEPASCLLLLIGWASLTQRRRPKSAK
jgi:hypothetical protein